MRAYIGLHIDLARPRTKWRALLWDAEFGPELSRSPVSVCDGQNLYPDPR